MEKTQANRLIAASCVQELLAPMGVIVPANERVARPLTKLLPEPEVVPKAWSKAVDRAEVSSDGKPREKTAAKVGMSHPTYTKAKAVVAAAEDEPEKYGDLLDEMDRTGRVVAKVEWHWDQLFPRVGFIVTNMTGWSRKVIKFYNGRGTAEQWIKEGKYAVKWTRLSCRNFRDNQARLQLFALAYNLGNFLRRLALPRSVKHWSLTTRRGKLVRFGWKAVRRTRAVESAIKSLVSVEKNLAYDAPCMV